MSFSLAIHGGHGTVRREVMTAHMRAEVHAGLRTASLAGHRALTAGGSAVQAVTASVMVLEDDPHFNAGWGAVYTSDGVREMEAAVMRGHDRAAGAVASIF
jgi:isoaspartyl peptidase/L-asparaginase-like protein (Ntn-hydrolase superfamily)